MRHHTHAAEVGGELAFQVDVDAEDRQKFPVGSVEGVGAGVEARENFPLGELVVAIVVIVNADKLVVVITQVAAQCRVEQAGMPELTAVVQVAIGGWVEPGMR